MNLKAAFVKVFNALSQSENSGVTKDRTVTEGGCRRCSSS